MIEGAAQPRAALQSAGWAALALAAGIVIALAPIKVGGGLVALGALLLIVIIEPVLGLVLMLAVAPLKTLIATEAPLALPLDVGQAAFGLAVGSWVLWRVTQRRYDPLPLTRLYVPLLAIMAGFAPSLFAAPSEQAWIVELLKWIDMLLLVAIVIDLSGSRRWTWIAFGIVLAAVLQALIGLYEFRGGSGAPHLWIAGYTHFRAFGTFGQPNPFSAFMGLTLPLALGLAWGYTTEAWTRWRLSHQAEPAGGSWSSWTGPGVMAAAYGAAALLLLAGLLASWGRGAWLGFGAAATVMVSFAPRRRWQGFLLVAVGGLLVLTFWMAGLVPLSIQQRIDNALNEFVGFQDVRGAPISDENFAIVERLAHWQAAVNMANDHPFVGVGLGNYEVVYAAYALPSWPRALGHAHNDYLNLLAETGIIGLGVYLAAWGVIVYWTLHALRQPDRVMRGVVLGLLGTWTHLAVHSMVDKLYVNNLFLHLGVMLGLLAAAYHHHQQSIESV
jgi:putative inorganic carbon (HCO3(-)) transporter